MAVVCHGGLSSITLRICLYGGLSGPGFQGDQLCVGMLKLDLLKLWLGIHLSRASTVRNATVVTEKLYDVLN